MADRQIYLTAGDISNKQLSLAVSELAALATPSKGGVIDEATHTMRQIVRNHLGGHFLSTAGDESELLASEILEISANLASLKAILKKGPESIEATDRDCRGYYERILPNGAVKEKQTFLEKLFGIPAKTTIEIDTRPDYDPTIQPVVSDYMKLTPNMGEYSMNQHAYPEFYQGSSNVGCCAVAYAAALSIIRRKAYDPTQFWDGNITSYSEGGLDYYGTEQPYDVSQIYEKLKDGKPTVIHYMYENGGQHYVTVVGVQEGANINDLQYSDLIAIDPATGTEKPLSECNSFYPDGAKSMLVFE